MMLRCSFVQLPFGTSKSPLNFARITSYASLDMADGCRFPLLWIWSPLLRQHNKNTYKMCEILSSVQRSFQMKNKMNVTFLDIIIKQIIIVFTLHQICIKTARLAYCSLKTTVFLPATTVLLSYIIAVV